MENIIKKSFLKRGEGKSVANASNSPATYKFEAKI
jgi:hypothetical protein